MWAGSFALGRGRRWAAWIVWVSSSLAFAACGHGMTFVMKRYDGPTRPSSVLALIRVNAAQGPDLVAVDGVPFGLGSALEPGNRIHLEVLPGTHEVDVVVTEQPTGLNREIPVRFVAEAGKVYRVELVATAVDPAAPRQAALDAYAYEVDRDTDARIRVATAAPAPPAAPPVAAGSARDAGSAPADADLDSSADGGPAPNVSLASTESGAAAAPQP